MHPFFLYLYLPLLIVKLNLSTVRVAYKKAGTSKEHATELFTLLREVKKGDKDVFVAYKGAVIALLAKTEKGVKNKKKRFSEGVNLIEYAVLKSPNSLEIRFVRLSVQQNAPKILKYNKQRVEDKRFVLRMLKDEKSKRLKQYIMEYVLASKHFTKKEKSVFSKN